MEKQKRRISILNDYSEYPGPRYCNQGDSSGEDFYHRKLNKEFKLAYEEDCVLEISLDGTAGYASSFLDEAFGNLVYDFTLEVVRNRIEIISIEESDWKDIIFDQTLPEWDKRRVNKEEVKKTVDHDAWYRLVEGEIEYDVWNER